MTIYRTCRGCVSDGLSCAAREALKNSIKGLRITSVKWACVDRAPKFVRGDPVWALTIASRDLTDGEEPHRDEFPGIVIGQAGAKMLIYIEPGSEGIDHDDGEPTFEPSGNGFCKIPISRLKPRRGDRQEVCRFCDWPTSKGHQEGYNCWHGQQYPESNTPETKTAPLTDAAGQD